MNALARSTERSMGSRLDLNRYIAVQTRPIQGIIKVRWSVTRGRESMAQRRNRNRISNQYPNCDYRRKVVYLFDGTSDVWSRHHVELTEAPSDPVHPASMTLAALETHADYQIKRAYRTPKRDPVWLAIHKATRTAHYAVGRPTLVHDVDRGFYFRVGHLGQHEYESCHLAVPCYHCQTIKPRWREVVSNLGDNTPIIKGDGLWMNER